jgi:hypothetical protein
VTKDGSGNQVVVPLGDAMKDSTIANSGKTDWMYILVYLIIPVAGLVGLIVLVGVGLLITNKMTNPGFTPPSATKSAVADAFNNAMRARAAPS